MSGSLFTKIAEAQAELGDLPRDREVNTGRYKYSYVTEDAITTAVRRILSPKGVAVFVSWDDVDQQGDLTTVRGTLTFADESGQFDVGIIGYGHDGSDKGLSKAQTSGLRIALCKTFLQAGDDDGEAEAAPRNQRQRHLASVPEAQPVETPPWKRRFDASVEAIGEKKVTELLDGSPPSALGIEDVWKNFSMIVKRLKEEAEAPPGGAAGDDEVPFDAPPPHEDDDLPFERSGPDATQHGVRLYNVTGRQGDPYTIRVYDDGSWTCSCPARTKECHHVTELRKPMTGGTGWLWPGDDGYHNKENQWEQEINRRVLKK